MLVLAGCGGGADKLERTTAMEHSLNAVAAAVRDPESELYHHRIQLSGAVAYGRGGWLVHIADRTSGRVICVTDLPAGGAITGSENISVAPCSDPRPDEPAPSSPPPA